MRRIMSIVILIILLLSLTGCQQEEAELVHPVQLFYCSKTVNFHLEDGLFASEVREFDSWENKPREFLNEYLAGPVSPDLVSPFPVGGWIIELSKKGKNVNVVLNINFTRLSPNELSTACACLSMTIFELMDAESVQIETSGYNTDQSVILMTRDNLLFSDNSDLN